jgi:hypothetical protein
LAADEEFLGLKRGDDDGSFVFTFKPNQHGVKGVEVAGTVPGRFARA